MRISWSLIRCAGSEVAMLKELTWEYVITNPALTTQQVGQRRVIRDLFSTYKDAALSPSQQTLFPALYQDYLREVGDDRQQQARLAVPPEGLDPGPRRSNSHIQAPTRYAAEPNRHGILRARRLLSSNTSGRTYQWRCCLLRPPSGASVTR